MARNDGIDRTSVRNANLTAAKIGNAQRHNEREKESYTNQDIVPERTPLNVHFRTPTASYAEMFAQMEKEGVISTRGLKSDANLYGELIFDVNSAYFYNHGGYDFAKRFYEDAYKSAVEIVGGEQYILSAVMHADERNRAMSEALGQDVYHYHLHVVYIPVVEKQILWSKRCKDKSLVGTVKETIMQVSSSKKWLSKPALDEQGVPILQKNGKPVLRKSYSVLQDDFFQAMRNAGYTDVERGERGSSEEHLTVTQFKVLKERERLTELTEHTARKSKEAAALDQKIERVQKQQLAVESVEKIEPKSVPLSSKVMLDRSEYESLATAAKKFYVQERKESKLQKALDAAMKMISELKAKVAALTAELAEYKSVRGQLHVAELEQENGDLRNKLRSYEDTISRNHLWNLFPCHKAKTATRDNSR
ncbi:plasmid recombination protein [Anaerotignum lactatifermentans]|uniref:Plasmid recombination protein n=1 Tax=Anaerotignum lactatifermentans TaxID=160404 RepID=A0A1Y3U7J7_9FIRM|nr:plasmid recombination protein [Anaerotignum lactatifermentans]OUN43178.1 plasmid recombination protein [Anaerotignum lactatifermentans]